MSLQILTIPCRTDNYAYLAHDPATGDTALVDVPEAAPVLDALARTGWRLTDVLITHHHADHVEGLPEVLAHAPARVTGAADDARRLPPLDIAVAGGDEVMIGTETGRVIEVPGHTLGHIAFHFAGSGAAFTADSLMALGCGRVFEGTMPQMHASLGRLAALPPDTLIYSGHEYTAANAAFARSVDPDNPRLAERAREIGETRAAGRPTVPASLALELETNPFLRAHDPQIRTHLGLEQATDAEVFAEIRSRKDRF